MYNKIFVYVYVLAMPNFAAKLDTNIPLSLKEKSSLKYQKYILSQEEKSSLKYQQNFVKKVKFDKKNIFWHHSM